MKSSRSALAAVLAMLAGAAWGQYGGGPVAPMTAPPSSPTYPTYSSGVPSTAVRPFVAPAAPRVSQHRPVFAPTAVPTATPASAESREERRFLRDAAAQSRFELEASKLAFGKSGNSAVRSLAASLINHHNAIGLELAHLLQARGMVMPMMTNGQRKDLNRLVKLNGRRFDSTYLQQVGLRQAEVAKHYEKAGAALREPQLNAWIARTLPTTRYHLMLAERAAPADPSMAKWNRAQGARSAAKAPVPRAASRSLASNPARPAPAPVAATVSGSGTR